MISLQKRGRKKEDENETYPCVSPATTIHNQSVRFVGTDFEGYTTGLGRLPRWQNLKQRRHTSLNTFHSWPSLPKDIK